MWIRMSTQRKSRIAPPTEGEIVLHVEIGRVPWKMGGEGNAIGEAFRIAGEYVGEHAFAPGSDPSVSFEFMGTTFTASASTPLTGMSGEVEADEVPSW
jgi:hypothetical protein